MVLIPLMVSAPISDQLAHVWSPQCVPSEFVMAKEFPAESLAYPSSSKSFRRDVEPLDSTVDLASRSSCDCEIFLSLNS